jgi:hypothetical protein
LAFDGGSGKSQRIVNFFRYRFSKELLFWELETLFGGKIMFEKKVLRALIFLVVALIFSATGAKGDNILFISALDGNEAGADDELKAYMEGLGHTVTYFDDDEDEATTEAAAAAADLVFISESVGSGGIREEITEVEVPMIVNEMWAWDEMGLTHGGGADELVVTTNIEIVNPGHPLAAGLSGSVTLLTDTTSSLGECRLGKGIAGDDATVIATATLADGETYDILFVYEKGAALPTPPTDGSPQVAADVRVCYGFHEFCDPVLTDNAYALLEAAIKYILGAKPQARNPDPPDGAFYPDMWVTLGWSPGDFAASHDVYIGDNFDDVNEATRDSELFRGNQDLTFYLAGFPGYAYPDGLVPGTTYYWRIDEVNDAEPNSPWKGFVWSFTIPPKTAYDPVPAEGAEDVDLNVQLSWTAGFDAKVHYVVFGEDFDEVNNAAAGVRSGIANYSPGPLKLAKTYYWRVDEFDGAGTYKGEVWSFTTEGAVSGPNPADGAVDVKPSVVLSWDAGAVAASHEVYFGTDVDAVKNATTSSPEYKGPKALGEESYSPGMLTLNTAYYWRIDEVNGTNPDSPWEGNVWSFTTGDFFIIDDFEDYNAGDNQIWFAWHDGLGAGALGTPEYLPGNGTGSAVGDENTLSYTEETIVHSGNQSMPIAYDNDKQGFAYYSEVELTLTGQLDWTDQGVSELSIWFRGNPASVGSFVEAPVGTYTMTATGTDIWNQADEFHFAFKTLTGPGTIIARVESVEQTDNWAKAGVMIRETLDAGSRFAAVYITPTNADGTPTNGCRFQARADTDASATSDTSVATTEQMAIVAPYWVKLERDVGGSFRGYYSANGSTWTPMSWNPQFIPMTSNVYVGLALTAHDASATCEAKFSNVTITGTVNGQWTNQDIGIESNSPEPLYVAVSNTTGNPAVIVHDDANASTIDVWTEWIIPLQAFADQGIILTNVDKVAIGLGTRGNMAVPGGSGKMYVDDIRLYRPMNVP